jgi:hypothetical protein
MMETVHKHGKKAWRPKAKKGLAKKRAAEGKDIRRQGAIERKAEREERGGEVGEREEYQRERMLTVPWTRVAMAASAP